MNRSRHFRAASFARELALRGENLATHYHALFSVSFFYCDDAAARSGAVDAKLRPAVHGCGQLGGVIVRRARRRLLRDHAASGRLWVGDGGYYERRFWWRRNFFDDFLGTGRPRLRRADCGERSVDLVHRRSRHRRLRAKQQRSGGRCGWWWWRQWRGWRQRRAAGRVSARRERRRPHHRRRWRYADCRRLCRHVHWWIDLAAIRAGLLWIVPNGQQSCEPGRRRHLPRGRRRLCVHKQWELAGVGWLGARRRRHVR